MKKVVSLLLAGLLCLSMAACGSTSSTTSTTEVETTPAKTEVRVASLKGPTSMGLVSLMDKDEQGNAENDYEFTIATAADEITAMFAKNEVDIALIPANLASVLNKKLGTISVLNINTLGVLYLVENGNTLSSYEDLEGKTIVTTGEGTTPEYSIRYILNAAGMSDSVTLEFKSEASEVAEVLASEENTIAVLPQPFVTSAMAQNDKIRILASLSDIWNLLQKDGSMMVTGVTVVTNEFYAEHPEAVEAFLTEQKESVDYVNANVDEAAELVEKYGIIKAAVAKKAIPYCNITCMTGAGMKAALSGYLNALYELNPASVGGELPADSFYIIQ